MFVRVIRDDGGGLPEVHMIDPGEGERLMADVGMEQHLPSKAMWPCAEELVKGN